MKTVRTPEFRVSFPNLFTPRGFEGQPAKYSVVMLFPKGADLSELKQLVKEAIEAKWPDPAKRPKGLRNPFRDGNTEKPDMDGYQDVTFVTASSKMRPGVVDRNVKAILDENDVYAGCYACATVTAFAYDKAGNRGVAFGLQNFQKLRDGDPFSGRSRAEDDFEPLPEELGNPGAPAGDSLDSMFD